MTWYSTGTVDPSELEARFSEEDSMSYLDSIFTEPSEESLKLIARVKEIMQDLPPREADFVDLYYFKHFRQTDIAHMFCVSQPTVCYRLQRATFRIQFLLQLPEVKLEDMSSDLGAVLPDELDIKIMILMYQTSCQSEVAKRLGVSQGLVRHRFLRSISRMEKAGLEFYYEIFVRVSQNLNVLREIPRSDDSLILRVVH